MLVKLSMGNGYSWIPFAVSELDILGMEISWLMAAEEKESVSAFRRTSCGQKPVVLLLNEGLYSGAFSEPPHDGYRQYFEVVAAVRPVPIVLQRRRFQQPVLDKSSSL